jgi:hypothetical protein
MVAFAQTFHLTVTLAYYPIDESVLFLVYFEQMLRVSFEAGEVFMRRINALATHPKECLLSSFSVSYPVEDVLQRTFVVARDFPFSKRRLFL